MYGTGLMLKSQNIIIKNLNEEDTNLLKKENILRSVLFNFAY